MINALRKYFGRSAREADTVAATIPTDASVESAMAGVLLRDLIRERRSDRRWLWVKRIGMALAFVIGLGLYLRFQAELLGIGFGPREPSVGVVRIEGKIGHEGPASAEKLVPLLEKAFESPRVKAVVLAIDSPGGAPPWKPNASATSSSNCARNTTNPSTPSSRTSAPAPRT